MSLGVSGGERGLGRNRIEGVGGVPDQRAAWLQLGGHLGAEVLDRLEGADQAAKLPALLGVGDGLVEHRLAGAQHVGRQNRPRRVAKAAQHRIGWGAIERFGGRRIEPQLAEAPGEVDGREGGIGQPVGARVHQMKAA